MTRLRKILASRLLVIGIVLVAAGIATAVAGYVAASRAASDRVDAERVVAAVEDEIAEAEDDLADATTARETASRDETQANAELTTVEDERARLRAELETLEDRAPGYIDAVADVAARAGGVQSAAAGLLDLRMGQAEALAAGDHSAFNDRMRSYVEPAGSAASHFTDLFSVVESLPAVALREGYRYEGPSGEAMVVTEPVHLDPPTGPAVVVMTLPEQIACQPWGNGGCRYSWEATIDASNWLEVTLTRIGVRYRGGGGYCVVGDEWADVARIISPNGSTTWSAWLTEDRDGECAPVLGGDLLVRWEATDAEGNDLSGRATADSAAPP
jgi:hypothetical protein